MDNPNLCFVLEFEDPKVYSVHSDLVCTLSVKTHPIVLESLENAFY